MIDMKGRSRVLTTYSKRKQFVRVVIDSWKDIQSKHDNNVFDIKNPLTSTPIQATTLSKITTSSKHVCKPLNLLESFDTPTSIIKTDIEAPHTGDMTQPRHSDISAQHSATAFSHPRQVSSKRACRRPPALGVHSEYPPNSSQDSVINTLDGSADLFDAKAVASKLYSGDNLFDSEFSSQNETCTFPIQPVKHCNMSKLSIRCKRYNMSPTSPRITSKIPFQEVSTNKAMLSEIKMKPLVADNQISASYDNVIPSPDKSLCTFSPSAFITPANVNINISDHTPDSNVSIPDLQTCVKSTCSYQKHSFTVTKHDLSAMDISQTDSTDKLTRRNSVSKEPDLSAMEISQTEILSDNPVNIEDEETRINNDIGTESSDVDENKENNQNVQNDISAQLDLSKMSVSEYTSPADCKALLNKSKLEISVEECISAQQIVPLGRDLILDTALPSLTKLLSQCRQVDSLYTLIYHDIEKLRKIGEGTFGEVFMGENTVYKIIPVGGNVDINEAEQTSFDNAFQEIVVSRMLSDLAGDEVQMGKAFCQLKDVVFCRGRYPDFLLDSWDKFKNSENERPDKLPEDQMYVVLLSVYSGIQLEDYCTLHKLTPHQAHSILRQICCSLAAAEQRYEFEHRDLHWGNVLIAETTTPHVDFTQDGHEFILKSHGLLATIIDFTFSRLETDGCLNYVDLEQEDWIFQGNVKVDIQYRVYRDMRAACRKNWAKFTPRTNVLWMLYLIDKMNIKIKSPKLRRLRQSLQSCKSASLALPIAFRSLS